jgi:hypothetical protein
MRLTVICTAIAFLSALPAVSQEYGSIKGRILWDNTKSIPPVADQKVTKEQEHCLANGPIKKDDLLIDPKTLGVKNVMIWLNDDANGNFNKAKIHPKLAAIPKDTIVIDQPRCAFVPRITMMRAGQKLEIKNSAPVAHNTRLTGDPKINGTINLTIPPKQEIVRDGDKALKAEKRPLLVNCDIHGWMGGRIGVFDHPYFALTKEDGSFEIKDVPAGKILIFMSHERGGWIHQPRGSKGQAITVPAGGVLDLGTIPFKPEYLDD